MNGSVCGCSPFTPDQVPAPVLQRRCQARPHFCEVMALYPVRTADAVVKVRMKNCRPLIVSGYKSFTKIKIHLARGQRILS